ncbi:MAG: hypothetical protein VB089_12795 [Anaerolineaceae bacterium]|nr:hypothetical protein [Anaerolineaceae bacterium]
MDFNDSISPQTLWRIRFARQVAAQLNPLPGLQAMAIGGSVARGYADAYSDLEIMFFWEEQPADDMRQSIARRLGARYLYDFQRQAREDNLLIDRFQLDLWHNTVKAEEKIIQNVVERFDTDLSSLNFLDTLQACIPLYGESLLQRWKNSASVYPPGLAVKLITQVLDSFDDLQLYLHALRENPTRFYQSLANVQEKIFLILLALNRRYYPTLKWMYPVLSSLAIKPGQVERRMRRAFQVLPVQAASETTPLLIETLDLVEYCFPQIECSALRRRLDAQRQPHTGPITLPNDRQA